MQDLLLFLQDFFVQFGFRGIAGVLSAIVAVFGALQILWKLGTMTWKAIQQRRLQCDLHPFYSPEEIQRATQYYVETKCQNVAPSKEEEPGGIYAFAARERIIPFFLKKAFKVDKDDCQFYIVLADSGMGKTTFLINLYLRYINQFFGKQYHIKLFPFNFPDIDQEIEDIPNEEKRQTLLLLDAFDEDIQAVHDYKPRLQEIIKKTLYFREVVITCRTQFFPSVEEEPKETGILRSGPEGGEREFRKFYVTPFDDKDIRSYLAKRFGWWQWRKKRQARQIVMSCPNLMMRPMLLSHIEDLLDRDTPYTAAYMVYAELIQRWIQREADKVPSNRRAHYKEELWKFSRKLAVDMYCHHENRQGRLLVPSAAIIQFANEHDINLKDIEMKSKSLLNRNAQKDYKFSHKSILEYFLAEEAFFNKDFRKELDFSGMDQAKDFFEEMIWEQLTVPFFSHTRAKGFYRLKDGKPKALAKLNLKQLPQITDLELHEWQAVDDVLVFKGLKSLQNVVVTMQMPAEQYRELQQLLPTCRIARAISYDEVQEVFGVRPQEVTIENQNYTVLRPVDYIQNEYEPHGDLVIDHATGLMWQKSGSEEYLTHENAQKYIQELNRRKFAGYADWRLPTISELMSLLEPEKKNENLYIDPVFDTTQRWCWSANRQTKDEGFRASSWPIDFNVGGVYWDLLSSSYYVRAVRSRQ